jgi:hypothetical protein
VDRERRDRIDPWELRAIREKKLAREQWDLYWEVQQMEHVDMINHPPDEQRDVRYVAKLCALSLLPCFQWQVCPKLRVLSAHVNDSCT